MAQKYSNTMTDALMLFGGGVVGAGLALLFAPQSGRKSRRQITRFSRSVGKQGERVMHNVTDFADKVGGMSSDILHKRFGIS